MEKEYRTVKKTMLEQICLTPYNPDKTLRLKIDRSSTEGIGFVLFQWIDELDPTKGLLLKEE